MQFTVNINDKLFQKFRQNYEELTLLPAGTDEELAEALNRLIGDTIIEHIFDFVEEPIMAEAPTPYSTVLGLE